MSLLVRATDGGSLFDQVEYRVAILDVNEPPVMLDTTFSITENSVDDTAVGTPIPVTDDDLKRCDASGVCTDSTAATCTGSCQSLDFQILSMTPCLDLSRADADNCLGFKIDRCGGQLTVSVSHLANRPLDYETQAQYVLEVQVTDDGRPTSLSDTASVTCTSSTY